MKAHPKHIDWGKVIANNEIMDGYVMPKYRNKNFLKDDSWIDIIMDDVYDAFYIDEEEEANVAKASEDMKLSIMKESEKARVKDYTKLVVTDRMVDYILEKYKNKWKSEDEIAYVILEDLWMKYGKDDKRKGKLVEDNENRKEAEHHHLKVNKGFLKVDLARAIKAKQVDDHDDDDLDSLDLENRIKKLEEDFGRLLKAKKAKKSKKANEAKKAREAVLAKQAKKERDAKKAREAELAKQTKKAREAELKENKAKKENEAELKAKKAKEAKEAMLAELKAKKAKNAKNAKEAMLAEVVQISSDEDDDEDPTAPTSTRSRAPTASTFTSFTPRQWRKLENAT
nr:hypothetical protein [Tanacetum cinerariifolium]